MLNGKAVLIFLCIFLAGGVAGGFVGMRIVCAKTNKKPESSAQVQNSQRRPIEEWSKRFQKDFAARVGITAEQQAALDPLVQAAQVEFRRLREQFHQQAADVTDRLDSQVMALLTPEQKPKYEQMISERLERLKKMEAERAAAAAAAARGEPPPKPNGPPPADKQLPPPPPSSTGAPPPAERLAPKTP